jgi:hypothetical protein
MDDEELWSDRRWKALLAGKFMTVGHKKDHFARFLRCHGIEGSATWLKIKNSKFLTKSQDLNPKNHRNHKTHHFSSNPNTPTQLSYPQNPILNPTNHNSILAHHHTKQRPKSASPQLLYDVIYLFTQYLLLKPPETHNSTDPRDSFMPDIASTRAQCAVDSGSKQATTRVCRIREVKVDRRCMCCSRASWRRATCPRQASCLPSRTTGSSIV